MAKKAATILILHAHHGDLMYLVDTEERQRAALRLCFNFLDGEGCYEGDEKQLDINAARTGDPNAILRTMMRRRTAEDESWEILEVPDPLDE
ncbi:MAG: hypothetical protein ABFC88_12515 [Thermoguttaceae bacterium]